MHEGYSGVRNIYYGLEASIQDGYVVVEYSKDGRGKRRLYVPTLLGAVDAGIYRAVSGSCTVASPQALSLLGLSYAQ